MKPPMLRSQIKDYHVSVSSQYSTLYKQKCLIKLLSLLSKNNSPQYNHEVGTILLSI